MHSENDVQHPLTTQHKEQEAEPILQRFQANVSIHIDRLSVNDNLVSQLMSRKTFFPHRKK